MADAYSWTASLQQSAGSAFLISTIQEKPIDLKGLILANPEFRKSYCIKAPIVLVNSSLCPNRFGHAWRLARLRLFPLNPDISGA
jgi:hypothetical protein